MDSPRLSYTFMTIESFTEHITAILKSRYTQDCTTLFIESVTVLSRGLLLMLINSVMDHPRSTFQRLFP